MFYCILFNTNDIRLTLKVLKIRYKTRKNYQSKFIKYSFDDVIIIIIIINIS